MGQRLNKSDIKEKVLFYIRIFYVSNYAEYCVFTYEEFFVSTYPEFWGWRKWGAHRFAATMWTQNCADIRNQFWIVIMQPFCSAEFSAQRLQPIHNWICSSESFLQPGMTIQIWIVVFGETAKGKISFGSYNDADIIVPMQGKSYICTILCTYYYIICTREKRLV